MAPDSVLATVMVRHLYTFVFAILLPLVLTRQLLRSLKEKGYRQQIQQRFGFVPRHNRRKPVIWLHAVSAGESIAAISLVEKLLAQNFDVVMTNMTPAGRQQVNQHLGNRVLNYYAPYDLPGFVARFLSRIRPCALLTMETELWPNTIHVCAARSVSVIVINGRLSEKSYQGYRRWAALSYPMLQKINWFALQSPSHMTRFGNLGVAESRMMVTGSIKFDQRLPVDFEERKARFSRFFDGRRVLMAASTHPGEEKLLLAVYQSLKLEIPELILVLAPRHTKRSLALEKLVAQHQLQSVSHSQQGLVTTDKDVYLLDVMGELTYFYGLSELAFVGGSLIPRGGHNFMEAALAGTAIVCGDSLYNFEAIAEEFQAAAAMMVVETPEQLLSQLQVLLSDPGRRASMQTRASQTVLKHQGALQLVEAELKKRIGTGLEPTS
jgi:3-deoxy-D-manno-octulosonic-acid transferase